VNRQKGFSLLESVFIVAIVLMFIMYFINENRTKDMDSRVKKTIGQLQNVSDALDAYRKNPSVSFAIVGDNPVTINTLVTNGYLPTGFGATTFFGGITCFITKSAIGVTTPKVVLTTTVNSPLSGTKNPLASYIINEVPNAQIQ
jgi:hypothetical protein